jgi:hypothetical protein
MNRSLATALELLAYGGSGPRVCHLNDYESIMAAWRTCEVIGGAPGATKSEERRPGFQQLVETAYGIWKENRLDQRFGRSSTRGIQIHAVPASTARTAVRWVSDQPGSSSARLLVRRTQAHRNTFDYRTHCGFSSTASRHRLMLWPRTLPISSATRTRSQVIGRCALLMPAAYW